MEQFINRIIRFRLVPAGIAALFILAGYGCIQKTSSPPNFVIIFTDDQGYGDLSCFGGEHVSTPRIDQMAEEGIKLTSFYVPSALCSPSRAALMTGSYPKRVGLATGSRFIVLLSDDEWGLNTSEITLAEILKEEGYATGIFGKWHLGDAPGFLPTRHGFDEYFGIPYSHDIHPHHPRQEYFKFPPLPLYEGETVIEWDPDADYLTQRITRKAVGFIENHKNEPFFLYVPHPLPHVPLHVSPAFMESAPDSVKEKLAGEKGDIDYDTRRQLLPQAISEIDWSVGEILDALKKNGLDENTMVVFTTDNGPAVGSAGPLRGKKGSTWEGGMRVPAIVRWPGKVPAGKVCDELLTSMDLFPTLAQLSGGEVPRDRIIDGKNIWPLLAGEEGAVSPHEKFFYHRRNELMAVRSGKWKLHRTEDSGFLLFDLDKDISEEVNLAEYFPEVVDQLNGFMQEFNLEMSDSLKTRPVGKVEN